MLDIDDLGALVSHISQDQGVVVDFTHPDEVLTAAIKTYYFQTVE